MNLNLYLIIAVIMQLQTLFAHNYSNLDLYWKTDFSPISISITSSYLTPTCSNVSRNQAISLAAMLSIHPQTLNQYLTSIPTIELFNRFYFYSNQNYLDHIRLRSGYEDFLTKLHKEIHSSHSFRKSLRNMTGFKRKRGFQELIDNEIKRIDEKKSGSKIISHAKFESQNTTQHLQFTQLCNHLEEQILVALDTGSPELLVRYKDRLTAAQQTLKNPDLRIDWSNDFDQTFFDHCPYSEFFEITNGTPLEYQLHQELCVTIRDSIYQLARNADNPQISALAPVVQQYAAIARHTQDYRAAFHLSDFCNFLNRLSQGFVNLCDAHPVTRVGRAVAQGVVDSAYDHLTYALEHPGEAAFDLAVLLVAPELRATVALCRLAALAHHAYQHREEISAVARQFMDDIQNNAHHDPEWLAQNGYIFTHVLSDVFVSPQIGNKLMNTGCMRPLANGLKRQTEAVQACIRSGVNAAGQKACDGLKNILQNAGEALKTGNPQPAFAGVQNNASLRAVDDQANRADGVMKKVENASSLQKSRKAGTVWDSIKITDVFYSDTKIPRSFEIAIGNKKFWIHPNATEHMMEYIAASKRVSHGMPIKSQAILTSFKAALEEAVAAGTAFDEIVTIGCWEIKIGTPRAEGLLPVIYHAQFVP